MWLCRQGTQVELGLTALAVNSCSCAILEGAVSAAGCRLQGGIRLHAAMQGGNRHCHVTQLQWALLGTKGTGTRASSSTIAVAKAVLHKSNGHSDCSSSSWETAPATPPPSAAAASTGCRTVYSKLNAEAVKHSLLGCVENWLLGPLDTLWCHGPSLDSSTSNNVNNAARYVASTCLSASFPLVAVFRFNLT